MTPAEAGALLHLLCAAFPKTKIEDATANLWLAELGCFDQSLGEEAVRGLIASSRFWPTIAELNEQVEIARVRRRPIEEHRAWQERIAAREQEAKIPLPPLREIPAVQELLRRFVKVPLPTGLPQSTAGRCDECGTTGDRYLLGRFDLCARCAARRQQARAKAEAALIPDTTSVGEADRKEHDE